MKLKFVGSSPVKGNVVSFVFEPADGQPLAWQAGQYMHYVLPHQGADDRGEERWFTNSAAPSEGKVMISTRIDREHGSSFKRALLALQPGDEIEADGPEGDFTVPAVQDDSRHYIFVAGGIGITPFRSILTEAQAQGRQLQATLLYSNRDDQVPFSEELESLAATNPGLKVEYVVQPERITGELIKRYADAVENPLVYIAGPEPMVKDLAGQLAGLGLGEESVRADDFPGYEAD